MNVYKNTMHLTFEREAQPAVKYKINLANNVNANGEVDALDNPYSYGGDSLYFKAGAYNQCSVKDDPGFWYAGCQGIGDWALDQPNGDYAQVTFSKLKVGSSTKP